MYSLNIPLSFLLSFFLCFPMQGRNVDSLSALLDSVQVDTFQVELRLELAEQLLNDDVGTSLEYAQEALLMAEELEQVERKAEAKLAIGICYDYIGVRQEAIEHLLEALEIFENLELPRQEARVHMLLGHSYYYLKQYESALKYYRTASTIGCQLKDTTLLIGIINATGAVYGNTGRRDSAMVLFLEGNALAQQVGNKNQVILTYFNMGDLNLYSGRVDDALGIFYDLEQNYDLENNSSKHLSNLYNSMTKAFIEKGDVKWAQRYSEKTREVLDSYTRLFETRDYYFNCYRIDSLQNNSEEALLHFTRYTHMNDSLNDAAFKDRLANLEVYFDLKSIESQVERLTLDNQFKDLQIKQRRIINYGSIALSIALLTILFLAIRMATRTRQKNQLLVQQKKDLEEANLKISAQSSDLMDKNQELQSLIEELKAT